VDPDALAALRRAHRRGARVVSICTGAFALAEAGLLDGRRATTHWADARRLADEHPAVEVDPDVLWVDGGHGVLTSAGVAAGIDLALHLYASDHGADAAATVARRMVVPPARDGGQAQYIERPVPRNAVGAGLAPTREWMLTRLAQPLTLRDMAAHAGYSERSFIRRFHGETGLPPVRWLHGQRVQAARRLLEHSDADLEAIASATGFGTAATLRLHFARALKTTPSAYRTTWKAAPARPETRQFSQPASSSRPSGST
jgi:transcriptional regulator GlxA family with amidase domain